MNQQERILKLAQEQITYIGNRGRQWGKTFTVGFNGGIRFTLENLWISVEEQMPEKTDEYFVMYNDGDTSYFYCAFFDTDKQMFDKCIHEFVTHWMPIPTLKAK